MDALGLIKTRRAIRRFKKETIATKWIELALEAGRWSPSGINNQPWRFMVLSGEEKNLIAEYTVYSYVVRGADKVILVFLDKRESYHHDKDLMAIGACIQSILLYVHSIDLGACWLGEILNKRKEIERLLGIPRHLELEAVIAVGKPAMAPKTGRRRPLDKLMVKPSKKKTR